MAIITNEDIKTMVDVEDLLHSYLDRHKKDEQGYDVWLRYNTMVEKFIGKKKEIAIKQNEWNKDNREYHNITNRISYYKSKNNGAKVEELRKELETLKGGA